MKLIKAIRKFMLDETGEVNVVAMVVLIGVAIILAGIFKDKMIDLLNDLLEKISIDMINIPLA